MAENKEKCDIEARRLAEQTANTLSAVINKSTEDMLNKHRKKSLFAISVGMVILTCGVLFLFFQMYIDRSSMQEAISAQLRIVKEDVSQQITNVKEALFKHTNEPGHHVSYGNTISNEKRISNLEKSLDKVDQVDKKAETNEANVNKILLELQEIKVKLERLP